MQPYSECSKCVAVGWCKKYKGEVPVPQTPSWCSSKFRLDKALALSGMPAEYLRANIYNYEINPGGEELYEKFSSVVDNIVEHVDKGDNFFFYSTDSGTGKTFHAACLLNHYLYKTCLTPKFDFEHPLGMFVVYADLIHTLRYKMDEEWLPLFMDDVRNTPLLVLDDIGAGTITDFSVEQTYLLINHRFNNNLSTVITSNFTQSKLKEMLGARITSRILSNCIGHHFEGKDRRTKNARLL